MAPDANPPAGADEERLASIAADLADRVEAVLPAWIEGLVVRRVQQWRGDVPPDIAADAARAGEDARRESGSGIRALLEADVDEQAVNPLQLLRAATRHAHDVLDRLGVPEVQRDEFARRSFPDDRYDLVPATWSDVDESLHEPGITWGAAKAFVHKARRRAEGRT